MSPSSSGSGRKGRAAGSSGAGGKASAELADVQKIDPEAPLPLYLVLGDEFLTRRTADAVVDVLVPSQDRGLSLVTLDAASPREVADELRTLPLLPGRKVVLCRDPEFLAPKKARGGDGLARVKDAWQAGRRKEAARRLLAIAARSGLTVDQVVSPDPKSWKEAAGLTLEEVDRSLLRDIGTYCQEEGVAAPEGDLTPLVRVLEGGLPEGHVLVIVTSEVDAKSPLRRIAKTAGGLIERKATAGKTGFDLDSIAAEVLEPLGKRLATGAAKLLRDRLKGEARLLASELEKLALYAEGKVIREEDVDLLVASVRQEEYLELSAALQERDLGAALDYVRSILDPRANNALQLLGAIAANTRTLLSNRARLQRIGGRAPTNYNAFKERHYPAIEEEALAAGKKPPHPFAVFKGLEAAGRYSLAELEAGLIACAEADLALKSSWNGLLVLDRILWVLCGRQHPPALPPTMFRDREAMAK